MFLRVRGEQRPALQGDADGQYHLGLMYATGRGMTKDEAEAVKWFRKAAAQANEEARKLLKELGVKL